MKNKIEMACNKCGAKGEIDKEKSTNTWTVYRTKCKCGGQVVPKF